MTNITPRELRQQLVMSMLFSKGDLYQEQERQRASAADCIEELEKKYKAACTLSDQYAKERDTFMERATTARNDALKEAAGVCSPTDFNDKDEVRVWEYACHKILALTTKETQ